MKLAGFVIFAMTVGCALGKPGNGNGNGNGNKKETSFIAKGNPHDAMDENGFPSLAGEMEDIDDLSDLADRKISKLYGLKQNPKAPVVFKVDSVAVEEVSTGSDIPAEEDSAGEAQGGTTTVTVWHGKENGKRDRTLSVAVGEDGSVLATCSDGEISYMIQSDADENRRLQGGKIKLKYLAAEINDLPEETEAEDKDDYVDDDGEGRRALFGNIRGATKGERSMQGYTYIRLRTVFTSLTRDRLGSSGCTNYHALAISQINQILSSSYSNIRFLNAGWTWTGFPDNSSRNAGDYLTALKTSNDYWMDYAVTHMQPNEDIDVLVVVGEYVYSGRASNVGWRRFGPSPYKFGYAEVKRSLGTLSAQYTYAHELGHLIGGCHDIDGGCVTANHGNVYESWCDRSVMAYPRCPSSCSSCPRYPEFTAGRWYDEGYNNAYYMNNFAPLIAGLY